MSKWWDGEPHRDSIRASLPDVPGHRAKKNKRRWCRGKSGVEHVVEIRLSKYAIDKSDPCHRTEWYSKYWWCQHQRVCINCGKILSHSLYNECPNFSVEITRFARKNI